MYSIILFVVAFAAVGATGTEYSRRCDDASPVIEFNEKLCSSLIWYVYASNIRCENCLFRRNITRLEPGLLAFTDTIESDEEKIVRNYLSRKENKNTVYHLKRKNPKQSIVIDSDCTSEDRSYLVSYDHTENNFQVFTNNLDVEESFVNSLMGVKKCNMEFQRYIRC